MSPQGLEQSPSEANATPTEDVQELAQSLEDRTRPLLEALALLVTPSLPVSHLWPQAGQRDLTG